MSLTLAAVIALSLLVRSSSQVIEECGCCGLAKELISDSDVLVNISANPVLEGDNAKVNPSQVEISESSTNPGWCSAGRSDGVPYDPYLTFEFNSTYLIELVKISGGNEYHKYVRTLSIKNDTGQGFAFTSNNRIPIVFDTLLTNGNDVRNISFMDNPVLATSLQIRPLNWSGYVPCMKIELHGCLYNNSQNLGFEALANNTDGDIYPQRGVLITLGIGAGFAGSLVTIVIILAAVGIIYCCRLIKKREFRRPKERSSSMDSDATLRVVNNILYRKRGSDRRPLAPSTTSTLLYETVPGEQDSNSRETAKPKDGENMEEQRYAQETPNKQQSATAIPVYEIQYEPVKIDEGLCVIREEAGEEVDDREQCKLRDQLNGPSESNSGTVGSHHSYEIIKNREGEVLETSSESFLDDKQQGRDMDGGNEHTQMGGGVTSTEPKRGGANKKFYGAKNVTYENISIALSPDTRHALFCESSGPQHFAV